MTPDERGTVFSAGLDFLRGQECTLFSPEIPQNSQNVPKSPQKGGNPPPNKSNAATIVFDKFGSKALPLFGVAFIRSKKFGAKALPLLGCCHY